MEIAQAVVGDHLKFFFRTIKNASEFGSHAQRGADFVGSDLFTFDLIGEGVGGKASEVEVT
jgi:hypothetical protein